MSNIEDDIKEIKNFTKASILYGNKIGITTSQHNKLRKAMQNILSEREQDKARIKELENRLRNINTYILINGIDEPLKTATQIKVENQQQYIIQEKINLLKKKLENSIPTQKIKDKIEELNRKEQELQNSITEEEREEYSDANISFQLCDIEIRREVLQELLQEREE